MLLVLFLALFSLLLLFLRLLSGLPLLAFPLYLALLLTLPVRLLLLLLHYGTHDSLRNVFCLVSKHRSIIVAVIGPDFILGQRRPWCRGDSGRCSPAKMNIQRIDPSLGPTASWRARSGAEPRARHLQVRRGGVTEAATEVRVGRCWLETVGAGLSDMADVGQVVHAGCGEGVSIVVVRRYPRRARRPGPRHVDRAYAPVYDGAVADARAEELAFAHEILVPFPRSLRRRCLPWRLIWCLLWCLLYGLSLIRFPEE